MAVRALDGETWARMLDRVLNHGSPVTLAWAAVPRALTEGASNALIVTVRGEISGDALFCQYDRLLIMKQQLAASEAAERLASGRVERGQVEFTPPPPEAVCSAYWLGRNANFGRTAPISTPSYYFSYSVFGAAWSNSVALARFDSPLSGRGKEYWPRASDAIFEVVFGVTRHQPRRDITAELVVHLPYLGPHIASIEWIDGQGLVIGMAGTAALETGAFTLHCLWITHPDQRQLDRAVIPVDASGYALIPIRAEPSWYDVALIDPQGTVVDSLEGFSTSPDVSADNTALSPEALLDAFDFFASVWRNAFGHPIIGPLRQLTPTASLALPVRTRADFESRLSQLDALLKNLDIPDNILDETATSLDRQQTLKRLESAFRRRLGAESPEYASTLRSITRLRSINDLRVAVQHPNTRTDVPSALSALGLGYTGEWTTHWQHVQKVFIAALAQLRLVLQLSD